LALVPSIPGLFIGLALIDIGRLLFVLAAQTHVGNLGEGRDLGLDYGWYGTAAAVGQLIGPALAGVLIDTAGYVATWWVVAGISALAFLALPRLITLRSRRIAGDRIAGEASAAGADAGDRQEPASPAAAASAPKVKKNLRYYLNTNAVIAILASFAVLFADGARGTFFPVLMDEFGYSATVIGIFLSVRALVSISVRFFMGRLSATLGGRFPALIFSIVSLAFGIALTPFCRGYVALSLNSILVGIGLGMALPLSMATVSEGVAPEDRGVAMGIRLTGNRLAQLSNPLFFGILAQSYGFTVAFLAGGALLLACAAPMALWWKRRPQAGGIVLR
jgi:MFS family permease